MNARRVTAATITVALVAIAAATAAKIADADVVCTVAFLVVCLAFGVLVAAALREQRHPVPAAGRRELDTRPTPYRRRAPRAVTQRR